MSAALATLPDDPRYIGFEPEDYGNGAPPEDGFDNLVGPFYYRRDGDTHEFLLQIEARHVNNGRIAHGGCLAALTDVLCSRAFWNHSNRQGNGFMTVSLTHEFIGAAPEGCWLLSRCQIRQEGGSIVFIDCEMFVKRRLVGLSRCVMKKRKPRA